MSVEQKLIDALALEINRLKAQTEDIKAESFKEGVIQMGCYLVDNHKDKFPGEEAQISLICDVVFEDYCDKTQE